MTRKSKSKSSRRKYIKRRYRGGAGPELPPLPELESDSSIDEPLAPIKKEEPSFLDTIVKNLTPDPAPKPESELPSTSKLVAVPKRVEIKREPSPLKKDTGTGTNVQMLKSETNADEGAKVLARITALLGDMKTKFKEDIGLEAKVENLRNKLQEIVKILQNLEEKNKENIVQMNKFKQEKNELLKQKEAQGELLEELQRRVKTQKAIVAQLGNKNLNNNEDKQKIHDLNVELANIKGSLETKTGEYNNLKNTYGRNNSEISSQIANLNKIKDQLDTLDTQIESQGKNIDTGFETFDKAVSEEGLMGDVTRAVSSVGTTINQFFGMGGGGKKSKNKQVKMRFLKMKRSDLEKLAKKWGIKNTKKYRNKSHLLVALTLILVFKTKSKAFTKKDMLVLSKNLDLKVDKKMVKKDLQALINKKTRRFVLKDLK